MPPPNVVRELIWNERCLVAWGGLRPGGVVTVHLPFELTPSNNTYAATCACMKPAGLFATWTFEFGYLHWEGATLCRNCFDPKKQKPKPSKTPGTGFMSYVRRPPDEQVYETEFRTQHERKEAVIRKLLNTHFEPLEPRRSDSKRVVEI